MAQFDGVPIWIFVVITLGFLLMIRYNSQVRFSQIAAFSSLILCALHLLSSIMLPAQSPTLNHSSALIVILCASLVIASIGSAINDNARAAESMMLAVRVFLFAQLILMLVQIIVAESAYSHPFLPITRASGFMREPSHLGVALSVPLAIFVFSPRYTLKYLGKYSLISAIMIAILCPSATLVALLPIALLLISLRSIQGILLSTTLGLLSVMSFFSASENLRYSNGFFQRIFDLRDMIIFGNISDSYNVSSIVLARGAYVASRVLENNPFGFGVNNTKAGYEMYGMYYTQHFSRLNQSDGASIFIKFAVEFGYVGVAILLIVLAYLSSHLFRPKFSHTGPLVAASLALIVANGVRGAGYFDLGILLPFAVAFGLGTAGIAPRTTGKLHTALAAQARSGRKAT